MNIDAKTFNTVQANSSILKKKIKQHNQVGFLSRMQNCFNFQKSNSIIHPMHRRKKKTHMTL